MRIAYKTEKYAVSHLFSFILLAEFFRDSGHFQAEVFLMWGADWS